MAWVHPAWHWAGAKRVWVRGWQCRWADGNSQPILRYKQDQSLRGWASLQCPFPVASRQAAHSRPPFTCSATLGKCLTSLGFSSSSTNWRKQGCPLGQPVVRTWKAVLAVRLALSEHSVGTALARHCLSTHFPFSSPLSPSLPLPQGQAPSRC